MIVGLNLKSIKAELLETDVSGEISVNSTPVIEDIEKKDLTASGVENVLSVRFSYETKYEPKVGKLEMEGEILYQSDDAEEILKKWNKEKRLDEKIAVEILNTLFRKCISMAISLTNELRLPPPIRFPVVRPKED